MKAGRAGSKRWIFSSVLALAMGAAPWARAERTPVRSVPSPAILPDGTRVAHIALSDVTAVAGKKGWLQEEFAKVGAKADLILVSAFGGSGVETSLLDRGELHITQRMAYPALQHRANGLDAVVVWQGVDPPPRRAVTLVLQDSEIQNLSELKGRTLGSSLVGCPYYASRETLLARGLDVDTELGAGDVRYLNITGAAAVSAFLAGRFEAYATHPAIQTSAPLILRGQVRELSAALPGGAYTTGGGRGMYFAMRSWAKENPDLVKAFLIAWDRTVRWLKSDGGAHFPEAAAIAARELRLPKAVALYGLKDESTLSFSWGQTDYRDAVDSIRKFQAWAIKNKDPFYTKHHLTDAEIEAFVDKRFFAGGDYFVDTAEYPARGK